MLDRRTLDAVSRLLARRVWPAGLACALLLAGTARAATILVPEFADDDPGEALKTRTEILKAAGAVEGLAFAPMWKFKKLAKAARLDPAQLGTPKAAKTLCKLGHLDGILGGAVDEDGGRKILHVQLFDPQGAVIYKRDVDVTGGEMRQDQSERIARGVAQALNLDDAAIRQPVAAKPGSAADEADPAETESDDHIAVVKPKHRAQPAPEVSDEQAERQQARAEQHLEDGPQSAHPSDEAERQKRFEDPTFELALGVNFGVLSDKLIDYTQSSPRSISDLESSLYPGFAARLQTFPFHARLDPLAGLGATAQFSYGGINVTPATGATFTDADLRFAALINYRFRLPILEGDAAIFSPSLGARAGLQVWKLDPPTNGASVYPLDRTAPLLGGEVIEPFGHYVRLILGFQYYFVPYPGSSTDPNSIEAAQSAKETFSNGFTLDGELQGHFGPANGSALTGSLKASYTQFNDCFVQALTPNGSPQGCATTNTQSDVDFWLLLGYAFY